MIELLTTRGAKLDGTLCKDRTRNREACGYHGVAEFQDFVAFLSD
jgi:hypothetical protein